MSRPIRQDIVLLQTNLAKIRASRERKVTQGKGLSINDVTHSINKFDTLPPPLVTLLITVVTKSCSILKTVTSFMYNPLGYRKRSLELIRC